jgi:hypothetical protein
MTLVQLGKLLEAHGVQVEVHHAYLSSEEEFRTLAIKNLQEANNYVIGTDSLYL